MIECNLFDIEVDVVGIEKRTLKWRFFTDLPCGTAVGLSIHRLYKDHDDGDCLWDLHDESVEVTSTGRGDFNGANGELVVEKADSKALKEFNQDLGTYSTGIKTPVSDQIYVSMIVGARQPLRAFGKNNANMTGGMVLESGDINVVDVEQSLDVPIKAKYQPFDFKRK